jgi:hypothetical protein
MMRNPLSGLMMRKRRKRVSELMMRNPLSELMMRNPLSGLMMRNPLSELMRNPLSELMRNPLSELMMRNPLSELMRNPLSKDFIKMYHKIQFGGGRGYFWQRALGLGAPCLGPTEKSCDRRQIYLYLNV